jgi:hypothetical protein
MNCILPNHVGQVYFKILVQQRAAEGLKKGTVFAVMLAIKIGHQASGDNRLIGLVCPCTTKEKQMTAMSRIGFAIFIDILSRLPIMLSDSRSTYKLLLAVSDKLQLFECTRRSHVSASSDKLEVVDAPSPFGRGPG